MTFIVQFMKFWCAMMYCLPIVRYSLRAFLHGCLGRSLVEFGVMSSRRKMELMEAMIEPLRFVTRPMEGDEFGGDGAVGDTVHSRKRHKYEACSDSRCLRAGNFLYCIGYQIVWVLRFFKPFLPYMDLEFSAAGSFLGRVTLNKKQHSSSLGWRPSCVAASG